MKVSKVVSLAIAAAATAVTAPAFAQDVDSSLYPQNTTVRDYAKRDRVLLGSLDYVSPSQLHENEGLRTRLGAEYQTSILKHSTAPDGTISQSNLPAQTYDAEVAYGWDNGLTLGIRGGYARAEQQDTTPADFVEKYEAAQGAPEIAYVFGDYFSIGAMYEFNELNVRERFNGRREFDFKYQRPVVGMSYHEADFEFGGAWAAEVQDKDDSSVTYQNSFALNSAPSANERAIYLPATGSIFARGNVSDWVSLAATASLAKYDGNNEGAVAVFEDYKTADRLASTLSATYWTAGRSRITAAAQYKGAASSTIGDQEEALGYRMANLYGGTLEGVLSLNRKTYLGASASLMRGERSDVADETGVRYKGREETQRYAGFITVKM